MDSNNNAEFKMNKKAMIIALTVALITLGAIGATYAYFAAVVGTGSTTSLSVTSKTVDNLTFGTCDNITLSANQVNFAPAGNDITATKSCNVQLKAKSESASTYTYTAKINVVSNNFVYTVSTTGCDPTQDGSNGTVSPNLILCSSSLQGTSQTSNGLTYTYNDDGTITLNGKPSTSVANITIPVSTVGSSALTAGTYKTIKMPKGTVLIGETSSGTTTTLANENTSSFTLSAATTFSSVYLQVVPVLAGTFTNEVVYPMISKTQSEYVGPGYVKPEIQIIIKKNGTTVLTKDMTTASGTINVNSNTITAAAGATTTDTWEVTATFKNYDANQNGNAGKNMSANLTFTKS